MLTSELAQRFAAEWIASWNSHDLDRVLSHYTDDFTMASPYIIELMSEPSGVLNGKANVRAYWQRALNRMPSLHFELLQVLVGAQSITLYYRNQVGRLAAEVLWINQDGYVSAAAHYADRADATAA
jgi:ketosteroid isomerase-like protein